MSPPVGKSGPWTISRIFVELRVRLLDQQDGGVDDLAQVVRRNVGRHAHRDAGRAVDQQVRDARRQDFGLDFAVVVIGPEIDGFLVDVFEQRGGDPREPGFGIPHGRGRIAVHRAEVPLAIDQRIAHGEILRHADERVVNRRVAVRVIFAEDFADDLGALAGGRLGSEAHLVHAEEDAPVHGLQAVANVGQRAAHDYAHRVIDVRPLHLVFDIDRKNVPRAAWNQRILRRILICHVFGCNFYCMTSLRVTGALVCACLLAAPAAGAD